MTHVWQLTGCLAALVICAQSATAQGFGFSVTTVNGVPMGGGFTVIGAPVQGNTYVRLGVNAWASHPATGSRVLGGFQQNNIFQQGATGGGGFNPGGFNAGQGNFNGGLQTQQGPTPNQFITAALKFDANGDKQFDAKEMENVAVAVIAELRRQKGGRGIAALKKHTKTENNKPPNTKQLVDTFVTRCFTFDADEDKVLDEKETRLMASALIKALI